MRLLSVTHAHHRKRIRRLALSAQGLLKSQPFSRGLPAVKRAINHLGYVQLDTISVVERAHHHVLFNRVPDFKIDMCDQLLRQCDVFEYWSHAAAILPMADFRFSLPYKHAIKSGQTHWFKNPDQKLMKELLSRIQIDGPLRARDIESRAAANSGWWDWKPAKIALEQLYMQGDLMVAKREGFQKTYDLTERILPAGVDTRMPSVEELAMHLFTQQLRCHGVVSLQGLTYLRRNAQLRQAMKNLLDAYVLDGRLQATQWPQEGSYYVETEVLQQPMPRINKRLSILSPFDNSVIQRQRLNNLFGFDYQIECYVPAHKRKYGYFSLPLLFGDVFIGRMDCKNHRKTAHLEIKSLYLENVGKIREVFADTFKTAIIDFMNFQQCKTVSINHIEPKSMSRNLKAVVNGLF